MTDLDHEARELIERLRKLGQQQATGDDFHESRLLTAKDTMYWVAADAITAALTRARTAEAEVARLREALHLCHERFVDYTVSHLAKKTADGHRKAERNREMADMCRAALEGDDK